MKKALSSLLLSGSLLFMFTGILRVQAAIDDGGLYNTSPITPTQVVVTTPPGSSASSVSSAGRASISSSCGNITSSGLGGIVNCFIGFLNDATIIIIALTVVVILIGGFNMISSEEKREEGKKTLMYGVIGLAVMVSVWGLVNIVISTFGIGNSGPISPPALVK